MLQCIHELGTEPVFLGLNTGNLGFLLNDVEDLQSTARSLANGAWKRWSFPLLSATTTAPDGTTTTFQAVNDLYAERQTGQTAHVRLSIDGEVVVNRLICDGLLVATALGSTAYSHSAGGLPCHPTVPAIHVTPICPHRPRLTPFVVPVDATINVQMLDVARRPVVACSDGVDRGPVQQMRVQRAAEEVQLAFLDGHNFTRTLVRKILSS
jgi:NAD+ kinase